MKKFILILFIALGIMSGCTHPAGEYAYTVPGSQGALSVVLQVPEHQKTYPLVMIMHGFNASKDMQLLTDLSRQLNARGIATLRFDFNGHGDSEGLFVDMTIPNELEDARRVYEHIKQLPRVSSVSAVGHSQGGIVAGMLAGQLGEQALKSVVLMAPAPELKEDTAKGDLFGVQYDPTHVPQYITLSNGLKVGRAYLETTPHLPIYEVSARYTGPVLVVHSQEDPLVPYRYGVAYSKVFPNAQLQTLYGLDHNFTQDTQGVNKMVADYFAKQLLNKDK